MSLFDEPHLNDGSASAPAPAAEPLRANGQVNRDQPALRGSLSFYFYLL